MSAVALPDGVTAARVTLNHLVLVRIQVRQLKTKDSVYLQAIYYRDPSHLSDLTKILTKNRTQDIILSPEHPDPFWTPTQLWPNVVRSIGVWARITSAVCARAQTLSPRWGVVGH